MEARMSHYTINSLSRPDLQSLARKANRERSASLKAALAWLAERIPGAHGMTIPHRAK